MHLKVIHRLTVEPAGYPDTLDGIKRFFRDKYGWAKVYHFLVWPSRVEAWCPIDQTGAHAAPYNRGSWGIGVIGDWRHREPPQEQWSRAVDLVAGLCWAEYVTDPWQTVMRHRRDVANVSGHGELVEKNCPGAGCDMDRLRHDVAGAVRWMMRSYPDMPPADRLRMIAPI